MTYTEIKKRKDKQYFYRVRSVRHGKKIEKERIYLGVNLEKADLKKLEEDADGKLLNVESKKKAEPVIEKAENEVVEKKAPVEVKKEVTDTKGITAEKDEFSDWFTQIMVKADLADYTKVSGAIVFKPTAYAMWEKTTEEINVRFKKQGLKNVYFPLLIPESLLVKEQDHVKGFAPEVAWVTHAGNTKLNERLAIRPTSEPIMYDSFSKWIRSWRDLPLKYNQWGNVVRWEFKHPVPFLRTREFLWQEGHTVYASKKEAEAEKDKIIGIYKDVCENVMALPGLIGRKSEKEKFAGAEYTYSLEYYMPNGKAIQGPDFHHDGQNFAKAYDIKFLDRDEKEQFAWQNTFGFTTRMLGVMYAVHSDKKGLVIPPKMAPNQIVIIPILFEDSRERVLTKAEEIEARLSKFSPVVDARSAYKPGYKFHEWEMKGVPIRIEIGPKDLKSKSVVVFRRDTMEKQTIKIADLAKKIPALLDEIQANLFARAQKMLFDHIIEAKSFEEMMEGIADKKISLAPMCSSVECEENLKAKSGGAKVLNIPDVQPKGGKCIVCGSKADYWAYVGKSY
jgi:prolyl-tRNA synthetase